MWAERYDRDLVDIFAVQDEVTREIVAALRMTLSPHQQARLARRDTANIDAYDYLLRGRDYLSRFTREANGRAGGMFEQARALDPDYAPAYAGLSLTYMRECNQGWSAEPEAARDRSLELAEQAVALDGSLAAAHETLSYAYLWKKRYDDAVAEAERAIGLDASAADSYATLGEIRTWIGEPEKTLPLIDKAMSLNPLYPSW